MEASLTISTDSATANQLVERARTVGELAAGHLAEIHQTRDLPKKLVEALRQSGLLRLYQPVEWGGYGCNPRVFLDVQSMLAEYCLSTAWVQGVLAVQSLVVALFPRQAQMDVWGENPEAVVSSAGQPTGSATSVKGGYRLSGRWLFSSGSSMAGWVMVGALTPTSAGDDRELRFFLVPRSDFRIDDVWQSFGLRGTASNDVLIDDVFVPFHRSYVPNFSLVNTLCVDRPLPALYRLSWMPLFGLATSNLAIGGGRAALRHFLDIVRTRVGGFSGKSAREDPAVHDVAVRLMTELETIHNSNVQMIERMEHFVTADEVMPLNEALAFRHQSTSAVPKITAIVEDMTRLAGARGVLEQRPLTRIWLDLCAARLHPGNDPTAAAAQLGRALLNPEE